MPTPTINAAVESRIISRVQGGACRGQSRSCPDRTRYFRVIGQELINAVRDALYMAKICSYAQGMALLRTASREYGYDLQNGEIAAIWRGGCIIRAQFLNRIREAYRRNPDLPNLLLDDGFKSDVANRQSALRYVVTTATQSGHSVSRVGERAELLRCLSQCAVARESDASPARLLWRAHVPTHR